MPETARFCCAFLLNGKKRQNILYVFLLERFGKCLKDVDAILSIQETFPWKQSYFLTCFVRSLNKQALSELLTNILSQKYALADLRA